MNINDIGDACIKSNSLNECQLEHEQWIDGIAQCCDLYIDPPQACTERSPNGSWLQCDCSVREVITCLAPDAPVLCEDVDEGREASAIKEARRGVDGHLQGLCERQVSAHAYVQSQNKCGL